MARAPHSIGQAHLNAPTVAEGAEASVPGQSAVAEVLEVEALGSSVDPVANWAVVF
jgi:hypothetical protein